MLVLEPPYPTPVRRLIYDGIPLVPVNPTGNCDTWVLPNGEVEEGSTLRAWAQKRGVLCVLFERSEMRKDDER